MKIPMEWNKRILLLNSKEEVKGNCNNYKGVKLSVISEKYLEERLKKDERKLKVYYKMHHVVMDVEKYSWYNYYYKRNTDKLFNIKRNVYIMFYW